MRQVGIIAVLLIVAAGVWYVTDSSGIESDAEDEAVITNEPDLYGRDIELTQFHADGTLHYRMNADAIRQFDADELTRMTAPTLHLTSPDQPPWDVESRHGYIRKRPNLDGLPEDVVYLREDVRMVQDRPQNGLVTLRSEAFYIYPGRQYAETDQDVMIDTNVGRTKAGGLRADLESGRLELTSGPTLRVHTIVLPEQFKKS
jgi:lipopolysaccharide export system protein LptC